MELSNFASIYCFITFIMGAVFMLIAVCTVAMNKLKEPRNRVRFFIMKGDINDDPYLYTKDINGNYYLIANIDHLNKFGINASEYSEMPIEEVREVFINLED